MSREGQPPVNCSPVEGDLLAVVRRRLFITVTEAAQILELDPRTLRRAVEAGEFPYVRISGSVRIPVPAFPRHCGLAPKDSDAEPAAGPALASTPTPTKRSVNANALRSAG